MTQAKVQRPDEAAQAHSVAWQTGIGGAVALAAVALAWATWRLPVGPGVEAGARWAPAWCALALLLCGVCLVWEARHGGWRSMPAAAPMGPKRVNLAAGLWVSAGLLLGALLMRISGFVLAATLCYVLALQGLRLAEDAQRKLQGKRLLGDTLLGLLVATVAYALLCKGLGMNLPTGWLQWM